MHLHRVVVLGGQFVLGRDPHRGRCQRRFGIAAVLGRVEGFALLGRQELLGQRGLEIGVVRLGLVGDANQARGVARGLECFGQHHGHRLPAEPDLRIPQGTERRARRRHLVLVVAVAPGDVRAVRVRQHLHHAGHAACGGLVDGGDAALGDRGGYHDAVHHARRGILGGIFRAAGDLVQAIDAVDGAADTDLCSDVHDAALMPRACRSAIAGWRPPPAAVPARSPCAPGRP